jgi:hypothetical protein
MTRPCDFAQKARALAIETQARLSEESWHPSIRVYLLIAFG